MITKVKNQSDAYVDEIIRRIACYCNSICKDINSVAEVEAFPTEFASLEGGKVYELIGAKHPAKGRCDIYILDTGNYRLVYVV